MKYVWIVLASFFVIFADIDMAWAQNSPVATLPNEKPLAKWLFSPTETKLVFEDGREANLQLSIRKKVKVHTKAQFIENSCFPDLIPKECYWDYEMGSYDLSFVWSKHPDTTKLNQVVTMKSPYSTQLSKLITTFNDLNLGRFLSDAPQLINKTSPVLSCDTNSWTLNFPRAANQNILIPTWSFEFMTSNPISGKNENQSLFQINDVELQPVAANSWKIIAPGNAADAEKLIPILDPNTLYYEKDNQECSVQIRIEKSGLAITGKSDAEPIEKTFSYPLTKAIPKDTLSREVFSRALELTREHSPGAKVTAE